MKIKEKPSLLDKILDEWLCLKQVLQRTVSQSVDFLRSKCAPFNLAMFFIEQGLRDTREREQEHRIIYVNNHRPTTYRGQEPLKYANNEIITSKVGAQSFYSFFLSRFGRNLNSIWLFSTRCGTFCPRISTNSSDVWPTSTSWSTFSSWYSNRVNLVRRLNTSLTCLFIYLFQLALPEPPKNPVTNMIPLTMVVLVTAIKQVITAGLLAACWPGNLFKLSQIGLRGHIETQIWCIGQ